MPWLFYAIMKENIKGINKWILLNISAVQMQRKMPQMA